VCVVCVCRVCDVCVVCVVCVCVLCVLCVLEADTWPAVVLWGPAGGVTSEAPQGAVGAGAGGPPLARGLPVALGEHRKYDSH